MQSGTKRTAAQSPPPITFPALTEAKATLCKSYDSGLKKDLRYEEVIIPRSLAISWETMKIRLHLSLRNVSYKQSHDPLKPVCPVINTFFLSKILI